MPPSAAAVPSICRSTAATTAAAYIKKRSHIAINCTKLLCFYAAPAVSGTCWQS
jgi:hypothetical protein